HIPPPGRISARHSKEQRNLAPTLTTFWTIENHPDQEVFREVFKAMDLAGGGEQNVSRRKLKPFAFYVKPSPAGDNHIKFVAGMRLLQIGTLRCIDLNIEGAVLEEFRVELAVARGNGVLRVRQLDDPCSREFHICSLTHSLDFGF